MVKRQRFTSHELALRVAQTEEEEMSMVGEDPKHEQQPAKQVGTPRTEEMCCAATPEDLCRSTLAHYEDISSKAHSWSSVVPRAIRFWFLEKPRLERELSALRAKLDAAEKALEKTNHECNQLNDMTIHQRSLVENLASMCRRLSYKLMRAGTSDTTVAQCVEFLKKHGLGGNVVKPTTIEKEKASG